MKLTFKEAYLNYLKVVGAGNIDVNNLDLEKVLDLLTEEYVEFNVFELDKINLFPNVLICEYGTDVDDELEVFYISFIRQFYLKDSIKNGYYGLTIFYDKKLLEDANSNSIKCNNNGDIEKWKSIVKKSDGYKQLFDKIISKVHFRMEKPK